MSQMSTDGDFSPIFKSARAEATFLAAYDKAMSLWPIPCVQRDVDTPFGSTHVIVSGPEEGPPMVLLHCALMTSAIWSPIIGELSASYRTYAVDVMGDVGRTVPTAPPATEADAADWLEIVFERLGFERAAVVAWSFGGGMASNFAMRHPDWASAWRCSHPSSPSCSRVRDFSMVSCPFSPQVAGWHSGSRRKCVSRTTSAIPSTLSCSTSATAARGFCSRSCRPAYSAISNSAS